MNTAATLQHVSKIEGRLANAGETEGMVKRMLKVTDDTDEQLLQAQKMEVVGRLAGGVAHDLNNVLTAVAFNAEIMLRGLEPGDALRERAEDIKSAARQASSMINRLLSFSNRQVRRPKHLDLNEVVVELSDLVERVVGKGTAVEIRLDAEPCRVRVDPSHLEQALLNLVINARDAMPDGGRLTLETANVELTAALLPSSEGNIPPGAYVMLTIGDSGTGMDADLKARIFEPFFTTKGLSGTGLGLSTVFRIIREHHGFIEVDSEVGHGSIFRIYVPSVHEPATPRRKPVQPARPARATILVVEDNHTLRDLMLEALNLQGHRTIGASSGRKALAIDPDTLAALDLVISDIILPDLTGPKLVAELRAQRRHTTVLYVSGYVHDEAVRREVETAETPFLAKPFTGAQLTAKVREVLDGAAANRLP